MITPSLYAHLHSFQRDEEEAKINLGEFRNLARAFEEVKASSEELYQQVKHLENRLTECYDDDSVRELEAQIETLEEDNKRFMNKFTEQDKHIAQLQEENESLKQIIRLASHVQL